MSDDSTGKNTFADYITAFGILKKYAEKETFVLDSEHDRIYAHVEIEAVSKEDAKKLDELGWHPDDKFNCWACFT